MLLTGTKWLKDLMRLNKFLNLHRPKNQKNSFMKKNVSLFVAAAFACIVAIKPASAQNAKGQSTITGGVGFSLAGMIFSTIKNAANDVPGSNIELKSTPGMLLNYDYGLADKFSVGLAFSYQQFKLEYTDMEYTNSAGYTDTASWDDKVSRMNVAIRPLFHFGNNPDLDIYAGARIGFTRWAANSSHPDPTYNFDDAWGNSFSSRVRVQTLFGLRYFFTPSIGFNSEFAIGAPYFFMMGINYRFPGVTE